MAKGGGTETTQTQNVQQSTTVTVQNVIEAKGLDPLERLNLLADVFSKIDAGNKKEVPQTVLSISQVPGAAFLTQPKFILTATLAVAGLILIAKKKL